MGKAFHIHRLWPRSSTSSAAVHKAGKACSLQSVAACACLQAFVAVLPLTTWAQPCWTQAAERYGISQDLLYAVARTESGLNPNAVNRSHAHRTSSHDIGLMQINSRHLPRLAQWGIGEEQLYDACTNLHVGAWLLADAFSRMGVTWDAVGSYNASCAQLKGEACTRARASYAWRVYRHLPATSPRTLQTQAAPRVHLAAPSSGTATRAQP